MIGGRFESRRFRRAWPLTESRTTTSSSSSRLREKTRSNPLVKCVDGLREKHKLLLKSLGTILYARTAGCQNARLSVETKARPKPFAQRGGTGSFAANQTNMKTKLIISGLAALLVLTLVAGCKTDSAASQSAQAAGAAGTQGLLDKARSLVADGRYQEAQTVLNQLSGMALSPDQQKLVTQLETQVQSALGKK
jgi:hypothetical protein